MNSRIVNRLPAPAAGKWLVVGFLCLGLLLAPGVFAWAANEPDQPAPPVRLKKKAKPKPAEPAPEKTPKDTPADQDPKLPVQEPKKAKNPIKEDAAFPGTQVDSKETVARVSKNMRAAEDRLNKKDLGDATLQLQRDIVKDLDALIAETQRQQQQSGGSGSSSSQNTTSKDGQQGPKKNMGGHQHEKPKQRADQGTDKNGTKKSDEQSKMADLYKDIWGHLPETLRQEMDAYAREQFMTKYSDLLKQYYSSIAEKNRRQGE